MSYIAQVLSQFRQHNCLHQAASLAFSTLLGLVPFSAVSLFLLKTFGVVENQQSPIIIALNDFFPSYRAEEIVSGVSEFANRNLTGLGIGGFLLLLIISVILFMSIEGHFNNIWGSRHRLPFVKAFQKYLIFCMLLLVGPLVIFFIFSAVGDRLLANLFPWLLIYCLFFFMYIALPNANVKWKAALFGALIAGTLFQIARMVLNNYFELVWQNYTAIYGTLAMLVILAVWVYATWIVILLGVEVTHTIHYANYKWGTHGNKINSGNDYINVPGIITLFLIVATHFYEGKGACSASEITNITQVSESIVVDIFKQFKEANLIYEVEGDTNGYIPATSLDEITLDAIVTAVDNQKLGFVQTIPNSTKWNNIYQELQQTQIDILKNTTVSACLEDTGKD